MALSHRFLNVNNLLLVLALFSVLFDVCFAARSILLMQDQQNQLLRYHNGALLQGTISVNLIWYGNFKPSQRAIVSDFVSSLSSTPTNVGPSVATWWNGIIDKYYRLANFKNPSLHLGKQLLDDNYSLDKSFFDKHIVQLASMGEQMNAINVVLTASDVTVAGFCVNRCGTHRSKSSIVKGKNHKFAYIWVGNSETQCPGYYAWPFHQPVYGPQNPPLIAPNNDIGMDGLVAFLSGILAGTATNPFGNRSTLQLIKKVINVWTEALQGETLGQIYPLYSRFCNCCFNSRIFDRARRYGARDIGEVPGNRSILNSTSRTGGKPGISSGNSLKTGICSIS
ncbi:protein PHOSPHATE-INDUCED 1-like [Henckelia pumila]|uniref:protein PHOSPHATE-INDUCED 1-like n=1 Tax=Henckelia pumila TaxID=405737 RepID=UPI003C6DDDB4